MKGKIKKGLLVLLMIVLLAPIAEHCTNFIQTLKLSGAYYLTDEPRFSFGDWWDGKFQEVKSKSLNDQVGFRPDLIRINNQIDYRLFSKLHFFYGILGRNATLWDGAYIDAYQGNDYIGYDSILKQANKFKKIQDTLQKLGKTLVMVHAPNKGFFYPENLPENRINLTRGKTNITTYTKIADSLGINNIDFNSWFIKLKKTTPEILYPRQGIHWSMYGAALGADSLIKYLENIRKEPLQHIYWSKVDHDLNPRFTDNDLAKALNLIVPVCEENFAYPQIVFPKTSGVHKNKVIYIGDSFLCQWYSLGILDNINDKWCIWFNFRNVCNPTYTYGDPAAPLIKDIDWMSQVLEADCIILLYTPFNLPVYGNGFIEKAYDNFYPKKN